MKNLLISTTSNWNIGDEVIRRGVQNLFKASGHSNINFIPYNRNPDLFDNYPKNRKMRKNLVGNYFNEVPEWIDGVVLAGSPEWTGEPLEPIYRHAYKKGTPVLALGVGYSFPGLSLTKEEKLVWGRRTNKITFRAKEVANEFEAATGRKEPAIICPSIFAMEHKHIKDKNQHTGYFVQAPGSANQHVDNKIVAELEKEFTQSAASPKWYSYYKVEMECFKKHNPIWLDNVDDLLYAIGKCQKMVTTRLHTTLPALYAGISVDFYGEDYRTNTALKLTNQDKSYAFMEYIKIINDWMKNV